MIKNSTFVALFFCFAAPVFAQNNWPEFRGPNGDGHATGAKIQVEFSEEMAAWKTPVQGKGWSSPVIWDQQVWMTTATPDGTKMWVVCLNLESGEEIFNKLLFENEDPDFCHDMNSYASPTPAIEEGKVYVHFGKYGTACLDSRSGEVLWQRRDLKCDHFRGPASSPILYKDRLFVAFDGFDVQYVVAFDKETGETIWKTDRDIDYGTDNGDLKKAYCTGQVFSVDGKPLLIYPSAVATEAFNPDTGKRKWICYHGGMNASARPLMTAQGNLILTNGMGKMFCVDPSGSGDITQTNVRWQAASSIARKSSPVIVDDLMYMSSDKGIVSCWNPETGQPLYRERIGKEYAASPVYSGEALYFFGREGDIVVVNPGPDFDLIAHTKLGDGFMASPAIAGKKIVLRSKSHVYCFSND